VITLTNTDERGLGLLLRQLRHDAGLSLVQLAERTCNTKGGISKREIHGRALTVGALIETADALGYDLALIPREDADV
jgi:transcriptional regulator with XRE-family HTH domain